MDPNNVRALIRDTKVEFEWKVGAVRSHLRELSEDLERMERKLRESQQIRNRLTALEDNLASLRESHVRYQARIAKLEAKVAQQETDIARFKDWCDFSGHAQMQVSDEQHIDSDARLSSFGQN